MGDFAFLKALQLLLIALKLTDNINWGWEAVLIPIYVIATIAFLTALVAK